MLHLIHNPVAGRGRARHVATRLHEALAARGLASTIWTTEGPGHARVLAARLPPDATVIAVGGDGTSHEVAGACIGTGRVLGVVPVGSGDDFAYALGIPRNAVGRALDVIAAGRVRTVDTGVCNGIPFLNASGVGFDAEVGRRVADAPPPLAGFAAYLWSVATSLRDLSLAQVEVRLDARVVYAGASLLVSTQNGPRTGGSFRFCPQARIDDGRLDVLVAGAVGRAGAIGLLPRVLVGRHLSHPRVQWLRGTALSLRWATERAVHLDGECYPPARLFELGVRPGSLHVLAP